MSLKYPLTWCKKIKSGALGWLTAPERAPLYTGAAAVGCLVLALLMFARCFFGVDLSDESYYIAEAKTILDGNVPYVLNLSAKALGFTFLLVPILFVYGLFVPELTGVVLVTRLCFTVFRLAVLGGVYAVVRKDMPRGKSLLLTAFLLPVYLSVNNFSYNTIPLYLLLLAGTLLYDAVEHAPRRAGLRLFLAGAISALALFANPGYGLALFCFLALILCRARGKGQKRRAILLYLAGLAALALLVAALIAVQTSLSGLLYGLYRLFLQPFPVQPLTDRAPWGELLRSYEELLRGRVFGLVVVAAPVFLLLSLWYHYRHGGRDWRQDLFLALSAALAADLLYWWWAGQDTLSQWGFSAAFYLILFAAAGLFRGQVLVWYTGLSPVFYALAAIALVTSDPTVQRFSCVYASLFGVLYALLRQPARSVRAAATVGAVLLAAGVAVLDFRAVYRDAPLEELTEPVPAGVYAGLYTTPQRAGDLPELERYLNETVGEDEPYAFRDNAPFAYLMMHRGVVCDMSTWDCLQYTYGRNAPALLFDYYRRRGEIPRTIVYIDWGRDDELSAEDPDFRYNDWLNAYYTQEAEVALDGTFRRVLVYRYNGTFDGDIQRWVDQYYNVV